MKLAVTGKGGAGKTTVAATLARCLARDGATVLAIDADPNPNLGLALGLGEQATRQLDGIVNAVLREKVAHAHDHDHDGEAGMACEPPPDRTAEELVGSLGVVAPDGVTLVQTGRIERPADGCLCCGSHSTTRRIFGEVSGADRVVVADLEAGVNDLIWTKPSPEDAIVVVTEPSLKSREVARRAVQVCTDLGVQRVLVVLNRARDDADVDEVRAALPGLEVLVVPDDDAVIAADRAGVALLDAAPDSPAAVAIAGIADTVRALTAPAARGA